MRIIILTWLIAVNMSFGMTEAMRHPLNARLAKVVQACFTVQPVFKKPAPVLKNVVPHHSLMAEIEKNASRIGISPMTMLAIEWHESGAYRSRLWRTANNPGGIEYRHFNSVTCTKHGRWACFATPEDGIKAHAEVLSHPRYAAARRTSDPFAQVHLILEAGYCEPGYSWESGVRIQLRRIMKNQIPAVALAQL